MRTTPLLVALVFAGCALDTEVGTEIQESHAWADYHWARTTDDFPLPMIDSVTSAWDNHLSDAAADWSASQRLDMVLEAGDTSSRIRRRCNASDGTVRVCNLDYGNTGWLGVAGISIDNGGHIVRGYTKLNDTYFADPFYDNFEWRQMVTCQEIGHNVGLGHQDEDFNNESLFSCMDYQNPPYAYPNAHDFDQLDAIYGHLDSYDSYATGGGGDGGGGNCNAPPGKGCNKANTPAPADWGESFGRRGNRETFIRPNPDGTIEVTTVTWAE